MSFAALGVIDYSVRKSIPERESCADIARLNESPKPISTNSCKTVDNGVTSCYYIYIRNDEGGHNNDKDRMSRMWVRDGNGATLGNAQYEHPELGSNELTDRSAHRRSTRGSVLLLRL